MRRLKELVSEINQAEKVQAERGIAGEPFAIFWMLKQEGIPISEAEKITIEIVGILGKYPHWKTSEKQSREIRTKVYELLTRMNSKDIPKLVGKIISVIGRKTT